METRTYREETPWGSLALQVCGGSDPWAALWLGGSMLMDSESAASERALATRGLAALREMRRAAGREHLRVEPGAPGPPAVAPFRVLLAGLGLGMTLRELLTDPGVGAVEVIEVFPAVVAWNHDVLAPINGGALRDPRVSCRVGDLNAVLKADGGGRRRDGGRCAADGFDLLLFDIDNGPTWLSLPSNSWLYGSEGLARVRERMRMPGIAAYWATERAPRFEAQLAALRWADWRREEVAWVSPRGGATLRYYVYIVCGRTDGSEP